MKTISALEAKNMFGQFLDAAQREPVVVTKNRREVAALVSMHDLETIASGFLSEPLKVAVAEGRVAVLDAIMEQIGVNQRLLKARADIAAGKGVVVDRAFFGRLRARIPS